MSSVWWYAGIFLLIVVWVIAAILMTEANVLLSSDKNKYGKAYDYTFWAAFATWSILGLAVLFVIFRGLGIIAITQSTTITVRQEGQVSWWTVFFFLTVTILALSVGILGALSASTLAQLSLPESGQKARNYCIWAAVICIASVALILIGWALSYFFTAEASTSVPEQ